MNTESVELLTSILFKKVAESVDNEEDSALMMYDLALQNRSFSVHDGRAACVLFPPEFEKKVWISALPLGRGYDDYLGRFIGSKGSGVLEIGRSTGCRISVRKTRRPHILVHGDRLDRVKAGLKAVEARLKYAIEGYKANNRSFLNGAKHSHTK